MKQMGRPNRSTASRATTAGMDVLFIAVNPHTTVLKLGASSDSFPFAKLQQNTVPMGNQDPPLELNQNHPADKHHYR